MLCCTLESVAIFNNFWFRFFVWGKINDENDNEGEDREGRVSEC